MTEAEIMKALECCKKPLCDNCKECPQQGKGHNVDCVGELMVDALDLINRKNAEIKRLTSLAELGNMRVNDYRVMRDRALKAEAMNERLEKAYNQEYKEKIQQKSEVERMKKLLDTECDSCACGLLEQRDKAKAEAIKEFLERVKEKEWLIFFHKKPYKKSFYHALDQIAKEMVGDTDV